MLVCLSRVNRRKPGESKRKFGSKVVKEMRQWDKEHLLEDYRFPIKEVSEDQLRDNALLWCEETNTPPHLVASALNIPRQRLSAWKAHKTMGTYENRG